MSAFDYSELDLLAETKDLFVVQQRPHYLIGSAFVAFGICVTLAGIYRCSGDWISSLVLVTAVSWPFGLGVVCFVRSVISLDVNGGTLTVRRTVLGIKIVERRFPLASTERVAVTESVKGSGLGIEMKNRRRESLMMSVGYRSISGIADRMNQLIHVHRKKLDGRFEMPPSECDRASLMPRHSRHGDSA